MFPYKYTFCSSKLPISQKAEKISLAPISILDQHFFLQLHGRPIDLPRISLPVARETYGRPWSLKYFWWVFLCKSLGTVSFSRWIVGTWKKDKYSSVKCTELKKLFNHIWACPPGNLKFNECLSWTWAQNTHHTPQTNIHLGVANICFWEGAT